MKLSFADAIGALEGGGRLSPADVERAFATILGGEWSPVQVGAFAIALRLRGQDSPTLVAAARALRNAMHAVETEGPAGKVLVDTCGTGGDGKHTLNVSTAAATQRLPTH